MEQNSSLPELEVEALIANEWIRVHARESRRGVTGQETLVTWEGPAGRRRIVREAWIENSRIRAAHIDE
jgi:hypothetical protein